jgi:NAD(P)H-dependent flavin oxidoreductase YrpB (nitropropane dioxygenase family)
MFAFADLEHPIVQAPMGGGPSTPELAAAVCEAGGLGILAGGYRTVDDIARDVDRLRSLTQRPFGLNIFAPPGPVQIRRPWRPTPTGSPARASWASRAMTTTPIPRSSPWPPRNECRLSPPPRRADRG